MYLGRQVMCHVKCLATRDHLRIKDDLDTFVDAFREEQEFTEEIRPVRMPQRERLPPVVATGAPVHPNHRYPVRSRQPFTARPRGSVVEHSYMKHRYQHSRINTANT